VSSAGVVDVKLPRSFVDRNLEMAGDLLFMGCQLAELSRDELIAVAACALDAERRARDEGARRQDFLFSLLRTKS
jgi:hypothetical protein